MSDPYFPTIQQEMTAFKTYALPACLSLVLFGGFFFAGSFTGAEKPGSNKMEAKEDAGKIEVL